MASLSEALSGFGAVIVTGGSSGIGKSFIGAMGILRPDLEFFNLSRHAPDINDSKLNLRHFPCDLAQPLQVEEVAAQLEEILNRGQPAGKILLINNSGFGSYGPFPEPNLSHQLGMIDVNMRALVQLTGLLLPMLRARGGVIMNIASTAAFQPTPWMATYGATKAFVLHWSLALDEDLRGSGVRSLAVCPGPTATNFFKAAGLKQSLLPADSRETCEQVVMTSLRALAAGKSQVVSGWRNRILAAIGSRVPKPLAARIAAKVIARYRPQADSTHSAGSGQASSPQAEKP
ncbi:MAG TPA: SDR family NAD(P)-dependent oxidoreductase [Opitutaceae bacterium]|nr:SDR family NAD(P)-dependent oxidoreductase [Opitutaceae bacterium]